MFSSNVEIIRPTMRFDEVIKTYGYPLSSKELSRKIYYAKKGAPWAKKFADGTATDKEGRRSRYVISKAWKPLLREDAPKVSSFCCDVMKKSPAHKYEQQTGRKPFIGTLACESAVRSQARERTGCNAFDSTHPHSNPMSFWTENDVLEYIKRFNLPYCEVYGEIVPTGQVVEIAGKQVEELTTTGCERTGCMFCMFGAHLETPDKARFVVMKDSHPKQYEYCMRSVEDGGLGIKDVIDWLSENTTIKIPY